jgi:hypothetical protein
VIDSIRRLGVSVDPTMLDFVSIALAISAADTFVRREEAPDGWCRDFRVRVRVGKPTRWQAVIPMLEDALRFLSGDSWNIELTGSGQPVPSPAKRGRLIDLRGHTCVSLFSGGLDSAIGVLDLVASGERPALVSHAYRGDQARQFQIHNQLPTRLAHFATNASPRSNEPSDVTMRTRSITFLAFGSVVASALRKLEGTKRLKLVVPENGVIALNPPLTPRRIGTLSTRTTHPHFLGMMQAILDVVGAEIELENPYRGRTKGEMLSACGDRATLRQIANTTVSCGKWKRKGVQCGRCVPCLLRRASFHAAKMRDGTPYLHEDLKVVMDSDSERDDLLAVALACRKANRVEVGPWLARSGPLPTDRAQKAAYVSVFARGMKELHGFLRARKIV